VDNLLLARCLVAVASIDMIQSFEKSRVQGEWIPFDRLHLFSYLLH